MSGESAFDKLHVEDKQKADLGGLLEELNVPDNVVQYVRKNQRTIYAILIAVIVAIGAWSLYGSYVENKLKESSSALAIAKKEPENVRTAALQKVISDFSGTKAALWAMVELAHLDMKNKQYAAAAEKYTSVRADISDSDPLYPLLTFGVAQAMEMENKLDQAYAEYFALKDIKGFENIGYLGVARIREMQGDLDKALAHYEEYRATITGENLNSPDMLFLQEKITNLKTKK
jgi:predicted negative regulator of RcsB-dependent stress response